MHVPLTRHIYVHQFNHISNLSSAFPKTFINFTSDSKQQLVGRQHKTQPTVPCYSSAAREKFEVKSPNLKQ